MSEPEVTRFQSPEGCANAAYRATWDLVDSFCDDEVTADLAALGAYNAVYGALCDFQIAKEDAQ